MMRPLNRVWVLDLLLFLLSMFICRLGKVFSIFRLNAALFGGYDGESSVELDNTGINPVHGPMRPCLSWQKASYPSCPMYKIHSLEYPKLHSRAALNNS